MSYKHKFRPGDYVRHTNQKYSGFSYGAILKVVAVNPTGSLKFDGVWGNGYNPNNFELYHRPDRLDFKENKKTIYLAIHFSGMKAGTKVNINKFIKSMLDEDENMYFHVSDNLDNLKNQIKNSEYYPDFSQWVVFCGNSVLNLSNLPTVTEESL